MVQTRSPLYLLSFSQTDPPERAGTPEDRAVGPAGEEEAVWMWVGEFCIAGPVLHMQWEGYTGVQGLLDPLLFK